MPRTQNRDRSEGRSGPSFGYSTGGMPLPPYPTPTFDLPLNDAGSGAVNTTVARGSGTATFTRATAAACRLQSGLWKLDVASGTARSHYSAGGDYLGYFSELAATQLLLNPRDMTQAAWVAGATMTVAQDGTGIDGVVNSCSRLTGGAVAATNTVLQTITAAASSRTYSCFVKRVTGTGTITLMQGTATLDITALINSTTFTQVALNDNELNVAIGLKISTAGDVILVDCNQFEAGANATTPIPAAGTRNKDQLSYASAVALPASTYCEFTPFQVTIASQILHVDDGSTQNRYMSYIDTNATHTVTITSGNVVQAQLASVGTFTVNTTGKCGLVCAANYANEFLNGVAGTADTSVTVPSGLTTTSIGNDVSSFFQPNGCIKNVRIWNTQLSDATMKVMTT